MFSILYQIEEKWNVRLKNQGNVYLVGITKDTLNSEEYEQVNISCIHLQPDCSNSQQQT